MGYYVTYCRNFTDIDDKLLIKAEKQWGDQQRYIEIADTYIKQYHQDMIALNCVSPDHEPRVTNHIPEIIDFIEQLVLDNKAYVVNGNVYFHIPLFTAYGKLSKHDLKDLRAGSRIDVDPDKKDPLDFALWKSEPEGSFWKSPWGYGRPGWHIECSALASYYLDEQIDIHGGGLDLVFPHHENEIAQSESLHGKPLARYWVHNGFVRMDAQKMSKSLGNIRTLDELFKQYDPMVIRFYFLNHHYRAPLDFSMTDIQALQKSYARLCALFSSCTKESCKSEHMLPEHLASVKNIPIVDRMLGFLLDDLNTVGMFGVLFEHLDLLIHNHEHLCAVKYLLRHVLGLTFEVACEQPTKITPEIQMLIDERKEARTQKDWARADILREQLQVLGVIVHDKKVD